MVTMKSKNSKSKATSKVGASTPSKQAHGACVGSCESSEGSSPCCASTEIDTWDNEAPWSSSSRWQGQASWSSPLHGMHLCARADIGFGNRLYIRGEGCGLSWEQGAPMVCEGSDCWRWQPESWAAHTHPSIQFKVLINDEIWSDGPNCCLPSDCTLEWAPTFSEYTPAGLITLTGAPGAA